jgi:hypothetical protein
MRFVHAVIAAVAIGLCATASAATPPRSAPEIVTQAHSGKTFRLAVGRELTVRLSGRWRWTEPAVRGRGVDLASVEYFVDPGYQEWRITARVRGRVAITSHGTPSCTGCDRPYRRFQLALVVG